MKSVLFFGPYPNPITGQSIAFKEIYDGYEGRKILCDITRCNNKLLNSIYVFLYIPYIFLLKSFDVVYFTCSRSTLGFIKDFWLVFFSCLFKKRVVNHLHGDDFNIFYSQSNYILKFFINFCYRYVETSIVLLPKMKNQFADFPDMNIEVVSNSFPKEFLDMDKDILRKDGNTITYFSNLMYSKGIIVFLDAIYQLLKVNPYVRINIAGAFLGDYLKSYSEVKEMFENRLMIITNNFPNRVSYLGIVKGIEKSNLLKKSDIMVLPTFYKTEAYPISIIEGMFYGNAIVATNHNYLPDIINAQSGVLVEKCSVDDLIKGISYLLKNESLLKSIQSFNRSLAITKYSPEQYVKNISKILN